jgi:aminopeptidase YwaD
MMKIRTFINLAVILFLFISPELIQGQRGRLPKTPITQDVLDLLANEISGQIIYNNEVILAGAPWIRDTKEFSDTFYESQKIYDIVRRYGIETVRLDRFQKDREVEYPLEAEFWILKPEKRLVARLDADAALIARGSQTADISGDLVYLPPLRGEEIKAWKKDGPPDEYKGKIVLMWSHAYGDMAELLDAAGIKGVISFNAMDRYFDPDQSVYAGGSYDGWENLKLGFTISWRQWSELLEDLESGKKLTVQCRTRIEKYPYKLENVFTWIPGSEPEKKGIIFTAHLFEGYTKRGANDNTSGCVTQLEILRALSKLIAEGALPQPRRTIYFLWPNEISGTYEHFVQNPGFAEKLSSSINMDMVGEGLRQNNALYVLTECTNYLPSYLEGLGEPFLNYVWRTNDIVYLPDSPRGRRGQVFPLPMWEKNGSRDAFRFDIQLATGGSDHICFNNSSVGVPAASFAVWPDQWYHADKDTPDKSDPTQLKRAAFIGAAMAWAVADCSDEVLAEMLDAVTSFGYERVGKRELASAMRMIDEAKAKDLQRAVEKALNLVHLSIVRESAAVGSAKDICSGSEQAERLIGNHLKQWSIYGESLKKQVLEYGRFRAQQLNTNAPKEPEPSEMEKKYSTVIPSIHEDVKGKVFYPERTDSYQEFIKKDPDYLKNLRISRMQQRTIVNYINGKRSVTEIKNSVEAETGGDLDIEKLISYMEFLQSIGWIEMH